MQAGSVDPAVQVLGIPLGVEAEGCPGPGGEEPEGDPPPLTGDVQARSSNPKEHAVGLVLSELVVD